jgi:two-component system sensor histidine kinase DcuS
MHGMRYSHPNPGLSVNDLSARIFSPRWQGKENVAVNHGVLAPALRVLPRYSTTSSQQIGVVVVGISLSKVDEQIAKAAGTCC